MARGGRCDERHVTRIAVTVDGSDDVLPVATETPEAMLARIASLEEEVRRLRAALAAANALGPDRPDGSLMAEPAPTTVTADGTTGMRRGTSGRR